jgi:hypothetical protein
MDSRQCVLVASREHQLASCLVKFRPFHRRMLRCDGNFPECPPQVVGKGMVELDREFSKGCINPLRRLYDH